MKLHFDSNLDFQLQAIEAVCDLFRGQEICRTEFTVTMPAVDQPYLTGMEHNLGLGNRLTILDEDLLENVRDVQLRNNLPPSDAIESGDFTVEMETGTGKTYVYLRTIFELNKRYGFTKFIIVVPSVAIKEGVYKTLQITEDHFRGLYGGVPFDYFLYDSSKLGRVRNFAVSSHIQIMVVTVGAINKKDVNNLYKDSEKMGGDKPIDLIKGTRPIVIVDEPQSVDGGLEGRGKEALAAMNPLCTLRYSATHADKHAMLYRLDAVDAYEKNLVKRIEVASAVVEHAHNKPFVRLISVSAKRGDVSAKVELDKQTLYGVSRSEFTLRDGDDLKEITGRAVYENCRIGEIRAGKGKEFMELRFPGDQCFLRPGETWGDVDVLAVQREMIRRTIREHLDKELRLRPRGIKVLSLFFIDQVARYRAYDENGGKVKGEYARIFEEEYRRAAKLEDYRTLFHEVDLTCAAEDVHEGYFSIDKKGGWTDTADNNQANRENAERAYNLIMKDKERLLSLDTPLKFIFSHSALREGWDNPNVFQICALREMRSERQRRQSIGRGMRLCVNQNGKRLQDSNVNTLTVIAGESYEEFAANLQREIEEDTGIRFGVVERDMFATICEAGDGGKPHAWGVEKSGRLWEYFRSKGYIDAKGRVRDMLRKAMKEGTLDVPPDFGDRKSDIHGLLRKVVGKLEIKNADERRTVRARRAVLYGPEFTALWDRIKHKTTYRVEFDNEALITQCIDAVRDMETIPRARLMWRKAGIGLSKAGVEANELSVSDRTTLEETDVELPDVLTVLQDRTQLTRRTIYRVITKSGRLDDFLKNPQRFIDLASAAINKQKALALTDGVKYVRLGDDHYYAQELFESEELKAYLKNTLAVEKSVYDYVAYDSETERSFAEDLDRNEAVKVYAKLRPWFKVPTPLGSYNPDWAVLVEKEGEERLYLVVETKGDLSPGALRGGERAKIEYGKAHFGALSRGENPAAFRTARTVDDLLA